MRTTLKAVVIAGALLCAPATAAAAEKPVVTTGAAASVTDTSVVLNGTVTPKGAATTYYFQYGTSSLYGSVTSAGSVAAGSGRVRVTAAITGLAPVTTYHYRLVAQNSEGVARGSAPHVQDQEAVAARRSRSPRRRTRWRPAAPRRSPAC